MPTKGDIMGYKPMLPAKAGVVETLKYNGVNVPSGSFDIDNLNMLQLVNNLRSKLARPSSRFLFISRRRNEQIELDITRVRLLTSLINDTTNMSFDLMNLQATIIMQPETLQAILDQKRFSVQAFMRTAVLEQRNIEEKLNDEYEETRFRGEARDHQRALWSMDIEDRKVTNEAMKIKNMADRANIEITNGQALMIRELAQNAGFKSMPDIYRVAIISGLLAPNIHNDVEKMEIAQYARKYMDQKMAADLDKAMREGEIIAEEVRKKRAEADISASDARIAKANAQVTAQMILNNL
ncbi:MAG: hypothetical protein ACD_15C00142G0002 [uncultured bacterium]|nr:MAG: hypothetical protein ACD_15C00142G0002 [uncultured bacterium]